MTTFISNYKDRFSKPMTEEEYVNKVLEATAQAERGEGMTVEELEKLSEKWQNEGLNF